MDVGRIALIVGGLAAAVVFFLVLRPDDEEGDGTAATTASAEPPRSATVSVSTPPPAPVPKVPIVRITIRGGELVGGLRKITVKRGLTVRLVVVSDVADHVHVHGIDVFRDVAPGKPARFTLKPTVAGRYEIELEDRGFVIAQLSVTQ